MSKEAPRLPMPERLEPKVTKRTLMMNVRHYFYSLYNSANTGFKELLASVSNKDAITGNRLFDRRDAVTMIKDAAKAVKDTTTTNAKDGEIYKCLSNLMRQNKIGLQLRREKYRDVSHQQTPAE
jgi:hypothetical protein